MLKSSQQKERRHWAIEKAEARQCCEIARNLFHRSGRHGVQRHHEKKTLAKSWKCDWNPPCVASLPLSNGETYCMKHDSRRCCWQSVTFEESSTLQTSPDGLENAWKMCTSPRHPWSIPSHWKKASSSTTALQDSFLLFLAKNPWPRWTSCILLYTTTHKGRTDTFDVPSSGVVREKFPTSELYTSKSEATWSLDVYGCGDSAMTVRHVKKETHRLFITEWKTFLDVRCERVSFRRGLWCALTSSHKNERTRFRFQNRSQVKWVEPHKWAQSKCFRKRSWVALLRNKNMNRQLRG